MSKKSRGHNTVEYIVLITAVISVAAFFLVGDQSPFHRQFSNAYGTTLNGTFCATQQLFCALSNTAY